MTYQRAEIDYRNLKFVNDNAPKSQKGLLMVCNDGFKGFIENCIKDKALDAIGKSVEAKECFNC